MVTDPFFQTDSPQETMRLAADFSNMLRPGDVLSLTGELGAGKTCFVKGLAEGLGVKVTVTSPTFALLKTYHGRIDLHHLDLYRLDKTEELLDIGIEDYLPGDGVTVIEWGEKAASILPDDVLIIDFKMGDSEEKRSFTMTARGEGWTERLKGFKRADPGI